MLQATKTTRRKITILVGLLAVVQSDTLYSLAHVGDVGPDTENGAIVVRLDNQISKRKKKRKNKLLGAHCALLMAEKASFLTTQ